MLKHSSGNGALQPHARTIPASARVMGLYVLAGRGTGKSRLLGRTLAMQDFLAGKPQAIIDPIGATIDNFLDKCVRFLQAIPKSQHSLFWSRIRYVDMSGSTGFVVPFPLYYRLGSERSLREIAERYLQVILKSNPALLTAQVQGWPPLHKIGTYTGMALSSLNLQITAAEGLLRNPKQFLPRLIHTQARYPELAPVIAFFRDEYTPMRAAERSRLTNPFMDKIFPFTLDPHLNAMFGTNTPGIQWAEVSEQRQTVLLDFRNVHGELRRFLLLWVFSYLYEWIKTRGRSSLPFGLIIDEFAHLTQKVFSGENPLAQELDEFINGYMRQHQIWFTAAHQELYQIDEQLRNTLLSLGTYILGATSSMEFARVLADALFFREPFWVKHYRRVWGSEPLFGSAGRTGTSHVVIAVEPEFMPLSEQREIFAKRIKQLGRFQFLLRPAESEGQIGSAVYPITIRGDDVDKATGEYFFPEQTLISRVRAALAATSGIPVAAIPSGQETRLPDGTKSGEWQLHLPRTSAPSGQRANRTRPVPPPPDGNPQTPRAPHKVRRRRELS